MSAERRPPVSPPVAEVPRDARPEAKSGSATTSGGCRLSVSICNRSRSDPLVQGARQLLHRGRRGVGPDDTRLAGAAQRRPQSIHLRVGGGRLAELYPERLARTAKHVSHVTSRAVLLCPRLRPRVVRAVGGELDERGSRRQRPPYLLDCDGMRLETELGTPPAHLVLQTLDLRLLPGDRRDVLCRRRLTCPAEDKRGEPRPGGGEAVEEGAILRVEAAA